MPDEWREKIFQKNVPRRAVIHRPFMCLGVKPRRDLQSPQAQTPSPNALHEKTSHPHPRTVARFNDVLHRRAGRAASACIRRWLEASCAASRRRGNAEPHCRSAEASGGLGGGGEDEAGENSGAGTGGEIEDLAATAASGWS